jgi:hypothetical protein
MTRTTRVALGFLMFYVVILFLLIILRFGLFR